MPTTATPFAVVQAQLDAYNAKDFEALLQTYAPDAEQFTRNFPEGFGTLEMLCSYEVADGRIQKASFAMGDKTFFKPL